MALVVNTNVPSLVAQSNLNKATNSLNTAMERLSTGSKINTAKDDAAGLYVGTLMDAQIRGSEVAKGNVQLGNALLSKKDGDLATMDDNIKRVRDLALQAANGVYSQEQLDVMQEEVDALVLENDRIMTSNFNGVELFTDQTVSLQVGPNSVAAENTLNIDNALKSLSSKLTSTNVSISGTQAEARSAVVACSTALGEVAQQRATIGSLQGSLKSAESLLTTNIENLSAAKSVVMDADIAKESSNMIKSQILQQTTTAVLSQANQAPSIALSLI